MKYFTAIALCGIAQGIQLEGIPKSDIMQNQISHWKKNWP